MNKTTRNDTLSPAQVKVLAELLTGKTITAAAAAAGVERATVHRWLREDFAFQAAWNRDRQELHREAFARLERLAAKAVDCLEKAIDGGDVKAALIVAKGMGILAPQRVGSGDAGELAAEAERQAKQRAVFAIWESAKMNLRERPVRYRPTARAGTAGYSPFTLAGSGLPVQQKGESWPTILRNGFHNRLWKSPTRREFSTPFTRKTLPSTAAPRSD